MKNLQRFFIIVLMVFLSASSVAGKDLDINFNSAFDVSCYTEGLKVEDLLESFSSKYNIVSQFCSYMQMVCNIDLFHNNNLINLNNMQNIFPDLSIEASLEDLKFNCEIGNDFSILATMPFDSNDLCETVLNMNNFRISSKAGKIWKVNASVICPDLSFNYKYDSDQETHIASVNYVLGIKNNEQNKI